MKRIALSPRPSWQEKVEALGLTYHTMDGETYWDESAYYAFSRDQIDVLETATTELQRICIEGAEIAIREDWRSRLQISEPAWQEILKSWERDDLSLYGRFDLLWDGTGAPKLLEYNADTPTGLLEAAVVQWHWQQECFPQMDQFNSLHEALIESWAAWETPKVHFTALESVEEDWRNLLYLEDTAQQAGKQTANFGLGSLGWDTRRKAFVTEEMVTPSLLFKLYPWEWMWQETFAQHLPGKCASFLEPVWKMLWSNKAFLILLCEKFPGHPNLLPASFTPDPFGGNYAAKPIFGREGSNVRLFQQGRPVAEQDGPWTAQTSIYQQLGPEVVFEGNHPIIGSWIIGGQPCGIGIREDQSRITANGSRFLPHVFS